MKVKIGDYKEWVGPYQIAEKIVFWNKDLAYRFGEWLANDADGKPSWLDKFCEKIHAKKKRKISVKLDAYDTWSADETLAYIILPILKQVKIDKIGSPCVDDCDVPLELHSTLYPGENEWDIDGNHHKRWEYVLDEMIWTFEAHTDGRGEDQFFKFPEDDSRDILYRLERIEVDYVGLERWKKRKQNGFRLFGKYYQSLWV